VISHSHSQLVSVAGVIQGAVEQSKNCPCAKQSHHKQ